MHRRILISAVLIGLMAAAAAYRLGRADVKRGVDRLSVPSLYAADANTYMGLAPGTVLPQERQVVSRTGIVEDRDVYYPGTEALAPDEMRVIACGTGMPNARPKQAAACWLVELGNGDKFLFDIGTGSAERISALKIPYDYLDKVFIGHLHSDHFGDADVPDQRSSALLQGRYQGAEELAQIVAPTDVMIGLLGTILTVERFVVAGAVIVGLATLATASLVFMLSLRLRRRELETMFKIGGSRPAMASIMLSEIGVVLAVGVVLAAGLTWMTGQFGALAIRMILRS